MPSRPSRIRRTGRTWRAARAAVLLTAAGLASLEAQSAPPQQPTFRSSVDITTLDVTVLDGNRRPVRGLSQGDFTVLVDGQPRPVVSFKTIDVEASLRPSARVPSGGDITVDAVTNLTPARRVLAIMIDDASAQETSEADVRTLQKTREIAYSIIDAMGPDDLAAVLFTNDSHTAQGFTTDRVKLKAAVDGAALFPGGGLAGDPYQRGDCYCGLCAIDALKRIADTLQSLSGQRKVVFDISVGSVVIPPASGTSPIERECMLLKEKSLMAAFRSAQRANVTINTIDPKGLIVGKVGHLAGEDPSAAFLANPSIQRVLWLQTIAENTGGRAVVRNNDPERQVPSLFEEASAYYLLGVDTGTPKDDGRFHSIKVRVNRPGVDVQARNGYYTPTETERVAMDTSPTDDWVRAIESPFERAAIALNATVAALASPDRRAILAIALSITRSDDPAARSTEPERIETVSAAFVPESGQRTGEQRTTVRVTWPPADAGDASVEVLSQLPARAGRYELRFGARTANDRIGSVNAYVDVPDFAKEPLSLSGAMLMAKALAAPRDAFDYLLPGPLTARRTFTASEHLAAFVRVYQGESAPAAAVAMQTHLLDAAGADRLVHATTLAPESFGAPRAADYRVEVPVDGLSPGEYLLRITAATTDRTVERTLRFKVAE